MAYALSLGVCIVSGLFFFKDEIIKMFTEDEAMVVTILSVLPIFYVYNIVDMNYSFFVGVVRALGTQDKVAYVSIAGYWLLSIPGASFCAFVLELSVFGLWLGYASGFIILTLIVAKMTADEDWQAIAESV